MLSNAGQRMDSSASPAVLPPQSMSRTSSLPSPTTSRRNSPSDQKATQHMPPSQQAYPQQSPSTTSSQYVNRAPNQGSNAPSFPAPMPPTHVLPSQQLRSQAPPHSRDHHAPRNDAVYPSPRVDALQTSTSAPYMQLTSLIQQTDPQIVRQVVRDCHQICLQGSEYHYFFLMNTSIHRAQPATINQTMTEFGSWVVQTSKHQLVAHLTASDIDELANQILDRANSSFLDLALAKRLETIRARSLVNALAKAERLGYDVKDIVEEKRDGTEHVIPYLQQELAQHPSQHDPPPGQLPSQILPAAGALAATSERTRSSHQFLCCNTCSRPVSGQHALRYHKLKKACFNFKTYDRVDVDICPHCGVEFTSAGGLPYHAKSNVCGNYTPENAKDIKPALKEFYAEYERQIASGVVPRNATTAPEGQPQASQPSRESGAFTAASASPGSTGKIPDAYAHLAPQDRRSLEEEMAMAEAHYGALIQKAMELPQPRRDEEVAKLKNSFNTKQSTTRKKYGVKLRERRSKAEIDAQRERLLTIGAGQKRHRWQEPLTSRPGSEPKRARLDEGGDSVTVERSNASRPAEDSPRKRVMLADMGGLGPSAATAEHTDPTADVPSKTQPQTPAHARPQPRSMAAGSTSSDAVDGRTTTGTGGTFDQPMRVDDSTDIEDSDSEEEDEDIPANLPRKN